MWRACWAVGEAVPPDGEVPGALHIVDVEAAPLLLQMQGSDGLEHLCRGGDHRDLNESQPQLPRHIKMQTRPSLAV